MRELSLRVRLRWLWFPLAASVIGIVLVGPLQDEEYWGEPPGIGSSASLWLWLVVMLAVPGAVLLGAVRSATCWGVGVLGLTTLAAWVPIAFATSESSTAGLAFIVPLIYGLPAAVLLAVLDRMLRSPSRGLGPAAPG